MCKEIQSRSFDHTPLEVKNAKTLRAEILNILNLASGKKILSNKPDEIIKLLKLQDSSEVKQKGYSEILGGAKNFKRNPEIPHFKLHSGCWFDFAITLDETITPAQIIAFDFEIRYPPEVSKWFLRFDLNLPDHDNDVKNMRFHFHPSNDDIMIHSPPMSPLEILHLFLYGIEIPEKQRS
ncbi:hypothetical protein Syn7502_02046 [Synechococcus sp. PCC 7502]|uniref:hypothetical protein n=1 Tax=Synechococcus sp. PCC 7502 TaxID=1173263 RepID=UPI00029F8097|nr:hypothetical protein [Synechococcus sp. PCC 7502]AFY74070.1 hypothetical protein Syn7502_02046 [Synechococcus sp. PCC 7502]